MDAISIIWH